MKRLLNLLVIVGMWQWMSVAKAQDLYGQIGTFENRPCWEYNNWSQDRNCIEALEDAYVKIDTSDFKDESNYKLHIAKMSSFRLGVEESIIGSQLLSAALSRNGSKYLEAQYQLKSIYKEKLGRKLSQLGYQR